MIYDSLVTLSLYLSLSLQCHVCCVACVPGRQTEEAEGKGGSVCFKLLLLLNAATFVGGHLISILPELLFAFVTPLGVECERVSIDAC